MKVTVSIPNVASSIEADLSDYSYQALMDEGRNDAVLTLLRSLAEVYGNEYINHELGDTNDDLTENELDHIETCLTADLFPTGGFLTEEDIERVAKALNDHSLQDVIGAAVREVVDNRYKTYRVNITCTSTRKVYIRARCANDIKEAIETCWDLGSLMEDGDLGVDDVSIETASDHLADMDIDDI